MGVSCLHGPHHGAQKSTNINKKMPELDLELEQIINFRQYPIDNEVFIEQCATELDKKGVLTLPNFINNETLYNK